MYIFLLQTGNFQKASKMKQLMIDVWRFLLETEKRNVDKEEIRSWPQSLRESYTFMLSITTEDTCCKSTICWKTHNNAVLIIVISSHVQWQLFSVLSKLQATENTIKYLTVLWGSNNNMKVNCVIRHNKNS